MLDINEAPHLVLLVFVSDIAEGCDSRPNIPEDENQQPENDQELPERHTRHVGWVFHSRNRAHDNRD